MERVEVFPDEHGNVDLPAGQGVLLAAYQKGHGMATTGMAYSAGETYATRALLVQHIRSEIPAGVHVDWWAFPHSTVAEVYAALGGPRPESFAK